MSKDFEERLCKILPDIIKEFGTPFHIYDAAGIIKTGERIKKLMPDVKEYFAVKANPNLAVMQFMQGMEFGFDCSSIPELNLARFLESKPDDIMFSSNNTSLEEFNEALADGGCILNLDDISMVKKVPQMPELICFRYNPGKRRSEGSNFIIGEPTEQKYGVPHEKIVEAYKLAIERGAKRFGIHTMICSNQMDWRYLAETVKMLLEAIEMISSELNIEFEFLNMGGGIGTPYRPGQEDFNLSAMAIGINYSMADFAKRNGYRPKLFMESGRYMTGPHGVLVTRCINRMSKYFEIVGVDASGPSCLMRSCIYDSAYHHITVLGKDETNSPMEIVNVVGSLCENNDQFAKERYLPVVEGGDILLIHNTGAHGLTMGSNYNGRLKCQELMLCSDGFVKRIRRAETFKDYFATQRNCD